MHAGNFVLVLHTHLPWVLHHGKNPHGSDWLSEAVAECYIPLLNAFNELMDEGIVPKVSLDISPVLCEQLEHPDFRTVFIDYCNERVQAARDDEKRFTDWGYNAHHIYLAQFWQKWYEDRKNDYINKYNFSIVGALRSLQDIGAVEILTCGATHGYLPLLGDDRSVNLQMKAAVENYKKHFGRQPRGTWLPECAYRPSYVWHSMIPVSPFHIPHLRPGIEQVVARQGIEFFFIDQNLTERAWHLGNFVEFNKEKFIPDGAQGDPYYQTDYKKLPLKLFNVSSSDKVEYGTAVAFTRYQQIAMQVWSAEIGYPGEPDFLDFHAKEQTSKLRYWRVTDYQGWTPKDLYHPDWTSHKVDLQSNHFIHHIENTLNWYKRETGSDGTVCIPFDTELFGHWWFEGPEFIKNLIRGLHFSPYVNTATASEQLMRMKPREVYGIPEGSWGIDNNHDVWSNEGNKWTWEMIYNAENRLRGLYQRFPPAGGGLKPMMRRIMTQALREMMLLQASDWQFIMFTQAARDYADMRFTFHNSDFNKMCDLAEKYALNGFIPPEDERYLDETEKRNSVFDELQLEWWEL